MEQQLNLEIGKWNLPTQARVKIIDLVKLDWNEATEEHVEGELDKHEKSAGLIGLWTNKTVQKIVKVLVHQRGWAEELAMERCKDLAIINMQCAAQIAKVYKESRRGLEDKLTKMEQEMLNYEMGKPSQWEQYTMKEEMQK